MGKFDIVKDGIEHLENRITAYWQNENYIEICNLAEKVLNQASTYYKVKGNTDNILISKICAYVMVSAIMIGDESTVNLIEKKKNDICITNVFKNDEICQWTLQALQILNIDYVRCEFIERIIPNKYKQEFDFKKFNSKIDSNNESNLLLNQIEERKQKEWNEFIERCQDVGIIDLKSIVLDFPRTFFEAETRNGFYIESLMKHAWAANVEILHKVDILCQALNIPYFVDWGTMLGTVRHKGFIPWDDDIDIGVLREDYNKLKYAINNCQNELTFYDVYEEADWGAHASKIVNTLTFLTDRYNIKRYHGFPFPASVDVFVIDCVPRDKELEREQYNTIKAISEVVHLRAEMQEYDVNGREYHFAKKNEKNLLDTIRKMCNIEFSQEIPTNQELFILKDEILSLYAEEQSDYYTVPHRLANGQDYYIPKKVFDGRIRMPFENIEVSVPSGYDFILKKNYGDNYMTPINRGGGHGYPFYNVFIDGLLGRRKDKSREDTLRYINSIATGYYDKFLEQKNKAVYQYEESYFSETIFDEHKVTEEIRRNRAAEMEVLAEIQRICEKKGIKYFAIGDTISGAVYYAGYEPNAEGIHLAMLRKDYVEFMNCLGEELDTWFTYESIYLNDLHLDMRSYITTDAYLVKDKDYMERFHGCREIVGIDISPIDMVDKDPDENQKRIDIINAMIRTASIVPNMPPYDDEILSLVDEWTNKLGIEIDKESNLQRSFIRGADTVASLCNEKSEQVRITPDLQVGVNSVYLRAWFDDVQEFPFEKGKISLPIGYLKLIGE